MIDLLAHTVFMQPFILAGLAALPVLWYILRITPPSPKLVHFPPTRFLLDLISEEHSPRHTPWWILLLRLLIAALIVIALARPVYNPADAIEGSGPIRLVIDDSWAAAQMQDLQQKAAAEILAQAAREKRAVYILTTAPQPGEDAPQHLGPMIAQDALSIVRGLKTRPWPADLNAAAQLVKDNKIKESVTSIWLSHGLDEGRLGGLVQTLQSQGSLRFIAPAPERLPKLLRPADTALAKNESEKHGAFSIALDAPRSIPDGLPVMVQAAGADHKILDIQSVNLSPSKLPQAVYFDIDDTLRGDLSAFYISGKSGSGGVFLLDESARKKEVGIAAPPEQTETAPLVEAGYYLKRALEPYASLTMDEPDRLLEKNPAVIVLPDIGAMPAQTLNALEQWVRDGGLLLRFSGPNMSQSRSEQYLAPVLLRAGERALSGSLSWEEPQKIAAFDEESPFYGIAVPPDVTVRQQVLADPAQDLEGKVWARLADGTPLITAAALEKGLLVLVHTTADPLWSDLSLSGLYLDILKKIIRLAGRPAGQASTDYTHLDPVLVLDGNGALVSPPPYVHPLAVKDMDKALPDSRHPPGLYGKAGFQFALNLGPNLPPLRAVKTLSPGVSFGYYARDYERSLMPHLLTAALLLFFLDWLVMMLLTSGLPAAVRLPRAAKILLIAAAALCLPAPAQAEDTAYAQGFYLAYVRTGDAALDETTRAGLETLAQTLAMRTSVEPDGVAAIDPESDTLAFFPLLYWRIGPGQKDLSDTALTNLQFYLDHGGTIVFDTRDNIKNDDNPGATSPNMGILRRITARLNIPPLAPIPADHVLGKTFYLLDSYPGRYEDATLWAEQQSASGRDGVSSVIIGSHDWAGAWAESAANPGGAFRAFPTQGATRQEMALRFGVNLVMYALTGNYKADQVHLPHILERLEGEAVEMQGAGPSTTLHFSPLLDPVWLYVLGGGGLVLLLLSLSGFRRGVFWRGAAFLLFMLTLCGPSLLREERIPAQDVAVIVVDRSQSQKAGTRTERTHKALAALKTHLEKQPGLSLRIIEAPGETAPENQTRLFHDLDLTLASIPAPRRAGVIFITDGQIHDIPQNEALFTQYGPVHALLSGGKEEKDRQIVITHAPAYGLTGQYVTVKYKIEDARNTGAQTAEITLVLHDGTQETYTVPVGAEQALDLKIDHPGQNVFALSTPPLPGEITHANNKTALIVNGVRDRLKVLLVSGHPHAGGRTWRDLLTSDPGVDLIHFTILREPVKLDYTPNREMSLIPFPFRALFEEKLYDFDLIIFDRYHQNNILPPYYYHNIVRYVEEGGAFLEASGPSFAGETSIFTTPLRDIIPGAPTGKTVEKPFRPALTDLGKKHPVTAGLIWKQNATADNPYGWGRWLRQVEIVPGEGETLMSGAEGMPLLLLSRHKKGRVAQIASDHIWLWPRGYDGGGPHAELLRRVVHWLMKEPELDEQALDVRVEDHHIHVRKQAYAQAEESIAVTGPGGESDTLDLLPDGKGWLSADLEAEDLGIYAFEDTRGARKFAVIGDLNPPELRDMRTTPDRLMPLIEASKGGVIWLEDTPQPGVKMLPGVRNYAGKNWIGLRRNRDYTVAGVRDIPLLPAWLSLLILIAVTTYAWWTEGRGRR